MPYPKQAQRDFVDAEIARLVERARLASGHGDEPTRDELVGLANYIVTRVLLGVFHVKRGQMRYADVNAIQGVLKCAGDEFYRRMAGEYEDQKAHENGDVPEYDYYLPELG